tara:strand:- start:183 stop:632 length:450 start_codon:yes stop_codon:yes gene_type:complete
MIKSYRHTGIVVNNLKKSEFFYKNLLGLEKVSNIEEGGDYFNNLIKEKNLRAQVLKVKSKDNVIIEIVQYLRIKRKKIKKPKTMTTVGTAHLCFTVKKIDNLYKKMKKHKVYFFSPPLKSDFDPVSTCFCYDPDYNLVQFVEGKQVSKK